MRLNNEVAKNYTRYADYDGEPLLAWFWNCRFDTGLNAEAQVAPAGTLDKLIKEELEPLDFDNCYCESHEAERGDFVSTFGGLFFLGILLSIIFLLSCVIIMYYKQVSEGFEDQSRFDIMQKVGMTKEDIRKSVNSQMLTVFLIPIIFACIHLAVVLPIVNKLLMLFGLFDIPRLIITSCVCVIICGIVYDFDVEDSITAKRWSPMPGLMHLHTNPDNSLALIVIFPNEDLLLYVRQAMK